jgi:hypothetical protein
MQFLMLLSPVLPVFACSINSGQFLGNGIKRRCTTLNLPDVAPSGPHVEAFVTIAFKSLLHSLRRHAKYEAL